MQRIWLGGVVGCVSMMDDRPADGAFHRVHCVAMMDILI